MSSFILNIGGALLLGVGGGYFLSARLIASKNAKSADKAKSVVEKAQAKSKEIILNAKEKSLKLMEESKVQEKQWRQDVLSQQRRLEKRENQYEQQMETYQTERTEFTKKVELLKKRQAEVVQLKQDRLDKLAEVSKMTTDQAKTTLFDELEVNIADELAARIRKLEQASTEEYERKAKGVLTSAMERVSAEICQETTTTSIQLPNDDVKGRIIGKEGRNIKSLEKETGVEIVVDDTPNVIWVSGFNPIRRHLAKRAIEYLIKDGRVHPGRIEESIKKAKVDLAKDIRQAGEEAAYACGVVGLPPKLIQILGRLKYRTSYGQNQLKHAVEVALISKTLAEELGADVATVVKGGLLHDLGKAVDHEIQGGHPEIGYQLMKKFGLPEKVARMAITHHEDNPDTLEGVINKVADSISGSRPGVRKASYENYVQRLDELEKVALEFPGVSKAYAIYAGRELRVFVTPEEIDDLSALKLARDIADKIERELKYPGEIRVNVIRETRIEEYAR